MTEYGGARFAQVAEFVVRVFRKSPERSNSLADVGHTTRSIAENHSSEMLPAKDRQRLMGIAVELSLEDDDQAERRRRADEPGG